MGSARDRKVREIHEELEETLLDHTGGFQKESGDVPPGGRFSQLGN